MESNTALQTGAPAMESDTTQRDSCLDNAFPQAERTALFMLTPCAQR